MDYGGEAFKSHPKKKKKKKEDGHGLHMLKALDAIKEICRKQKLILSIPWRSIYSASFINI